MNILGLEISWGKPVESKGAVVSRPGNSWWGVIRESFAGAWQRGIEIETKPNLLAFSAVYACVSLIADDIAKLRLMLVEQTADGIWKEVKRNSPYMPVLRKPNPYQTRIQFISQWIISKLLYGNAYIYKEYDQRGIVTALYCLDPRYVTALVDDEGGIWYQLHQDALNDIEEAVTIPAEDIIHDRCVCLFHPLMGVSPIYAAGRSATQGLKIQENSSIFFGNMSRPSGHLSSDGNIEDNTAKRLKEEFEKNFSSGNLGRLLVTGDGLKYEPMTIPAIESQLIEQLKWTVEDVARCFRVPLHKISSASINLTQGNVGAINQDYYTQTLQIYIECIELLLTEGLGLDKIKEQTYGVEIDTEELLRMDPLSQAERNDKRMKAGYLKPNEARAMDNLPPVEGGDTPYLQEQNWPLAMLAGRQLPTNAPAPTPTAPAALPAPAPKPPVAATDAAKTLADAIIAKFIQEAAAVEIK